MEKIDEKGKVYIYKLVSDEGGAPFVTTKLLTLAICKPAIRRTAKVGDLIFGFGSNNYLNTRLVYVAEITSKLSKGSYYEQTEFFDRLDCIYERKSDKLVWKKGAKFHINGEGVYRDLGHAPYYKNANVLISSKFKYYGDMNYQGYASAGSELRKFVEAIGQGHRVHSLNGLQKEFEELASHALANDPSTMKLGEPSHKSISGKRLNEECPGVCITRTVCRPDCW